MAKTRRRRSEAVIIALNGPRVREIIAKKHLKHKIVAKKVGTTPRYFSQLLARFRNPSPDMRIRITKFFAGYSFADLFVIVEDADVSRLGLR